MQFQVPQFIEVEDKIFGPLTLKQFLYIAGGVGVCLMLFAILPLVFVIMLGIPVMGFAAALAFYEINGRPFIVALEHAFGYILGSKLYLWKQRQPQTPKATAAIPTTQAQMPVPKLSESKLKDLAWSLNIKDRSQEGRGERRTGLEI